MEAVAQLAPGVELGDPSGAIRLYQALLLERLHQESECTAAFRALAEARSVPAEMRRHAEDRLARHTWNALAEEVKRCVAERRFAAAHEAIAQYRAQAPRTANLESQTTRLEKWLGDAERRAAH